MSLHRMSLVVVIATVIPFLIACASSGASLERSADEATESDSLTDGYRHYGDPAVVALLLQTPDGASQCTGTVIGAYTVLTAAHCLRSDTHTVTVYFGNDPQLQLDGGQDWSLRGVLRSTEFFPHPSYDSSTNAYDAAIVWLPEAAPVAPAYVLASDVEGLEGYVTKMVAFGANQADPETGQGSGPWVKQIGYATILDLGDHHVFTDGRGGWTNQCRGDSGSPLLMNAGGSEFILGISSYGDRPCETFSAFQRVDTILPWIEANVY